jgi:hypothetical protein
MLSIKFVKALRHPQRPNGFGRNQLLPRRGCSRSSKSSTLALNDGIPPLTLPVKISRTSKSN